MTARTRRITRWVLLACIVAILVITFWPTPVDRPFDSQLARVIADLHRSGVPAWIDYRFVETSANVLMFVPLGALIALYFPQSLWWFSGVLGLALSLCVELGQYVLLPARFASAGDLVANTAGAFIGGAIVALVHAGAARRAQRVR
jgi:VanZ family protein